MVVNVGIHVVVTPEAAFTEQVRMTVEETEPGAVEVDTDTVVDELWAMLTSFVVRVGVVIHVWAMLEQIIYYKVPRGKKSTKSRAFKRYKSGRRWRVETRTI
jgi:ppGpp synthetase/RelA/SpoT-type nucleotidyltranferase